MCAIMYTNKNCGRNFKTERKHGKQEYFSDGAPSPGMFFPCLSAVTETKTSEKTNGVSHGKQVGRRGKVSECMLPSPLASKIGKCNYKG